MSSTHPSPTLPQPLRWLTTPSSSLAGTVDLPLAEFVTAKLLGKHNNLDELPSLDGDLAKQLGGGKVAVLLDCAV